MVEDNDKRELNQFMEAKRILAEERFLEPLNDNNSKGEGPTRINRYIYIGDYSDANSLGMLKEMGITHALNCAGATSNFFKQFPRGCRPRQPFVYKQFEADDVESYDMSQHFEEAIQFVHKVKESGGKVLVYCRKGTNRSVAVCTAYLIRKERMTFLDAVRLVHKKRGKVLTNLGFLKQLLDYSTKD